MSSMLPGVCQCSNEIEGRTWAGHSGSYLTMVKNLSVLQLGLEPDVM